ncbi:hypothetical protein AKO1_010997 [Acrasis kona]|uniref:Flavin reductase like domain-containing protein n=1 Tax=Acrasis kona TaxID=1008807 RepID=A0AAW2YUC9_9EUKA
MQTPSLAMSQIFSVDQPQLLSRFLYTNPVCLLTSSKKDNSIILRNIMTISWITLVDNHAHFICSMNKKRFTASLISESSDFILNVPVKGMESVVTSIGGCTGQKVDKWAEIPNVTPSRFGWMDGGDLNEEINWGIDECAAQLRCVVDKIDQESNSGHNLLHCTIKKAFVKEKYWNGKHFAPRDKTVMPYLTFLGSGKFGYVTV